MRPARERLLPIGYAIDSVDALRIEEERRLFYVAATRAKDRLTFTTAEERLGRTTRGARHGSGAKPVPRCSTRCGKRCN